MTTIVVEWLKPTNLLQWLKDLGPLFVSLAVFFVTWSFYRWQRRLAKQKLRHDLYDRRFAIYMAFQELLLALVEPGHDEMAALKKANIALSQASFLFDDRLLQKYLKDLYEQTQRIITDNMVRQGIQKYPEMMNDPKVARDLGKLALRRSNVPSALADHFSELPQQFARVLKLTDFWK